MQITDASDLSRCLHAMFSAALWAEVDEDGEPFDATYTLDDVAPTTRMILAADLRDFLHANAADVRDMDPEQVGHDFWLTRQGHGAGFWDRGTGEVGERLTHATRPYGSVDLYVGDDGRIYGG